MFLIETELWGHDEDNIMPLSKTILQGQMPQQLMSPDGSGAFASRFLQHADVGDVAVGRTKRGHINAREIFAMGETHSRWAHAASTKTAVSNRNYRQERDHESGE